MVSYESPCLRESEVEILNVTVPTGPLTEFGPLFKVGGDLGETGHRCSCLEQDEGHLPQGRRLVCKIMYLR